VKEGYVEGPETTNLDWETFDYSDCPKADERFGKGAASLVQMANSPRDLKELAESEAREDEKALEKLRRYWDAWDSLSPDLVARATETLRPFIREDRAERMESVLKQRTKNCRFLFENPSNPSNVWACLRTIDSFGVQDVDLVVQSGQYEGKGAIAQKSGLRTAMGSAQWLSLTNHPTTASAVAKLKSEGYKLYASDLNPNSKDVRDVDWSADGDRPICIVMGNEGRGISQEMRELADETFTLPMCGFAESFNLSVATAITLAHLSAKSGHENQEGPLRPGDMDEHEYNRLLLKGIIFSLPQRRTARALLKRNNVVLPNALGWM